MKLMNAKEKKNKSKNLFIFFLAFLVVML